MNKNDKTKKAIQIVKLSSGLTILKIFICISPAYHRV